MHLGMSGSFRVERDGSAVTPGAYYHDRSKDLTHDHVVFRMSSGATIRFNDPRRFGSMKLVPRARLDEEPLLRALGPEPLGNEFDAAMLAAGVPGQEHQPQGRAARSAGRRRARQHLRLRGAQPRAAFAEAQGLDHRRPRGAPNERADAAGRRDQGACCNDAIEAGGSSLRDHRRTDGELGMFQHNFRVYDREGKPCPTRGCKGTIKRIVQSGRSTFFCPVCQK